MSDMEFSFEMDLTSNVKMGGKNRKRRDNDDSANDFLNSFHISGGWKIQTTPTNSCKDDVAQLIVADISPLRPCPEASKHVSSIFGHFEIDEGNPLHLSETELFLRANDCQANPATQVIIKFIIYFGLIIAEI